MIIDANIILRCILNDNEELAKSALQIIENNSCFATKEVIAEVVYVLLKVYNVPRAEIKNAFFAICEFIDVENENVIKQALNFFEQTKLDFVDCVLASYCFVEHRQIATFDQKLNNFINSLLCSFCVRHAQGAVGVLPICGLPRRFLRNLLVMTIKSRQNEAIAKPVARRRRLVAGTPT